MPKTEGIVIDINVFLATGFNPRSTSARVLEAVRDERSHLIWNQSTQREIEMILRRIRRVDWDEVANLFQPEGEFTGPVASSAFVLVRDRDDRKFAALSADRSGEKASGHQRQLSAGGSEYNWDRRAHAARLPGTSGRGLNQARSRSWRHDRERAGISAHKSRRTTKLYDRTGDEIRSIRSSG